jgi:hypothetical protein
MNESLASRRSSARISLRLEIRNEIDRKRESVSAISEGPFDFDRNEISEVRFWTVKELELAGTAKTSRLTSSPN